MHKRSSRYSSDITDSYSDCLLILFDAKEMEVKTMKSLIDSIYDGDIRPAEDILEYSDELRALYLQASEKLIAIRNTLSDDQKEKFDDYSGLKNRICDESARVGFQMGLSFGVKLMTESFSIIQSNSEEMESDNT